MHEVKIETLVFKLQETLHTCLPLIRTVPVLEEQISVLKANQDTLLRELLDTKTDLSKAYDTIEDLKYTIAKESFERDREGKNVVVWNLNTKELSKHRGGASSDREAVNNFAVAFVRKVLPGIGNQKYTARRLPQNDDNNGWRMVISFKTTADAQDFVLRCPKETGVTTLKLGLTTLQRRLITKTRSVISKLNERQPQKSETKFIQHQQYKVAHVPKNDVREIITVDDVSKFITRTNFKHDIILEDLPDIDDCLFSNRSEAPLEKSRGSPCTTSQFDFNMSEDKERNDTFETHTIDRNMLTPLKNPTTNSGHFRQKKLDEYFTKPKGNPKTSSPTPSSTSSKTPLTVQIENEGNTVYQNGKIMGAYDCKGCNPDIENFDIYNTSYKHTCGWEPEDSIEESPQLP